MTTVADAVAITEQDPFAEQNATVFWTQRVASGEASIARDGGYDLNYPLTTENIDRFIKKLQHKMPHSTSDKPSGDAELESVSSVRDLLKSLGEATSKPATVGALLTFIAGKEAGVSEDQKEHFRGIIVTALEDFASPKAANLLKAQPTEKTAAPAAEAAAEAVDTPTPAATTHDAEQKTPHPIPTHAQESLFSAETDKVAPIPRRPTDIPLTDQERGILKTAWNQQIDELLQKLRTEELSATPEEKKLIGRFRNSISVTIEHARTTLEKNNFAPAKQVELFHRETQSEAGDRSFDGFMQAIQEAHGSIRRYLDQARTIETEELIPPPLKGFVRNTLNGLEKDLPDLYQKLPATPANSVSATGAEHERPSYAALEASLGRKGGFN